MKHFLCLIGLLMMVGCSSSSSSDVYTLARNEICESEAYRAIAATYYQQLHPKVTWVEALNAVDIIMPKTRDWLVKKLKEKGL